MSPAADETAAAPGRILDAKVVDGDGVRYRERLGAPIWAWLVMLGLALCLAIAFWVPLGATAGLATLIVSSVLVVWLLLATAATIVVTGRELRINRAHIDANDIGLVATLDEVATVGARGANADPRAFAVLRPLSAKESVSLEILDEEDPHPYWLISTRHPQDLGAAIRLAQEFAHATGSNRT